METKIIMSRKQLKQAHVLRNYNERRIDRKTAAEALGLSERQITRLAKGMKENGELALIHKNTGRKPAKAIQPEIVAAILSIRTEETYKGCNITHFKELLEREHGLKISYNALYRMLTNNGIVSPKKHSGPKPHRRRKRKPSAGELIQIDASPFDWLSDGKQTALQGAVDDATGMITGLYMTENECLHGYCEIMTQTVTSFGVPLTVYSDKHTIFRSPTSDKKESEGEDANLTQFGRALAELGVNIIYAHSPQAKGRIERLWSTLQSRLPVELRLRGIKTIEAANAFLAGTYIPMYNERFAVKAEAGLIFIPYTHKEDIANILCVKEKRKTDNAGSFSFRRQYFTVLDRGYPLIPSKAEIEVLVNVNFGLRVRYKGRVFETVIAEKPVAPNRCVKRKPKIPSDIEARVKPYLIHGSDEWKRIWHYEDYNESLAFIYELLLAKYA